MHRCGASRFSNGYSNPISSRRWACGRSRPRIAGIFPRTVSVCWAACGPISRSGLRSRSRATAKRSEAVRFPRTHLYVDGSGHAAQHRAGSVRRVVRRRFAHESRDVSLAVDGCEVSCGPSPRPSAVSTAIAPVAGCTSCRACRTDWQWTAAARVHWGGRRHTYVMDHVPGKRIVGDLERKLRPTSRTACFYAGTDVSEEATVSPVDVAAIDVRGPRPAGCGSSPAISSKTACATWRSSSAAG